MPLLDQHGNPIRRSALRTEHATPTLTGVRPVLSDHPAQGLTPSRLANLLRNAEMGDTIAYLELSEEMEEKDLHYRAVLSTRKLQVAGLPITVEAAEDTPESIRDADLVRATLTRDDMADTLFDMLDALGKGFSVTEILWDTAGAVWQPRALKWRDPRWFVLDDRDGTTLRLRDGSRYGEDLPPGKYIVHRPKIKSGLNIRGGLARVVSWIYLFKNFGLKSWVQFVESYGHPIRLGKYGPEATDADKSTLLSAVRNLAGDMAAIVPQSMLIELVDPPTGTSAADMHHRLVDFLDQQVSKAVLGQTTTTDAISGGHAVSREHRQVQEDLERADARQLGATLMRDLVVPLIKLNHGDRPAYPRVIIGRAEHTDIAQLTSALSTLVPLGLRVSEAEVRDKIGLADPDPDEQLLTAPQPAADPFGGWSQFGGGGGALPMRDAAAQAAALPAPDDAPDTIDQTVERVLAEGPDLAEPLVAEILRTADDMLVAGRTVADFQVRLMELAREWRSEEMEEYLARLLFAAQVAGRLGEA